MCTGMDRVWSCNHCHYSKITELDRTRCDHARAVERPWGDCGNRSITHEEAAGRCKSCQAKLREKNKKTGERTKLPGSSDDEAGK